MITLDEAAAANFETSTVDDVLAVLVRNGRSLPVDLRAAGTVAVLDTSGRFLALYEQRG
ncbi:MAG: hypothetical protein WKF73_17125 [Nocardioidaceae bacterium]